MRIRVFLALSGALLLAGCGEVGNTPVESAAPKVKIPYHIEFATQAPRPNPAGVTLPAVFYKANTRDVERRGALVVRFEAAGGKNNQPVKDRVIMAPINLAGASGDFTGSYMELADQTLGKMLGDRCVKGTVKVSVALVRSSIRPAADDKEIDAKRLTDWLPAEVVFKNPHPKC